MRFEMEPVGVAADVVAAGWMFPSVDGNRVVSSVHPSRRDVREGWRSAGGERGRGERMWICMG